MSIQITTDTWLGTAEQIESVRQLARDYPWGGPIEDAEHAAGEVIAAIRSADEWIDIHPDAEAKLRAALVESAEAAR